MRPTSHRQPSRAAEQTVRMTLTREITFLFAAGFLAYVCNHVFMIILPQYVAENGWTLAEAGLQSTVFVVAAVILRFWFGPLANEYGNTPFMIAGALAFAVSAPLLPLCGQFWQLLAVRALQAVGLAAFFPSATAAVAQSVPKSQAGRTLGLYRFVSSAALMAGPPVILKIASTCGYRTCFWILGLCAIAACALVAFSSNGILRKGASRHHSVKAIRHEHESPQQEGKCQKESEAGEGELQNAAAKVGEAGESHRQSDIAAADISRRQQHDGRKASRTVFSRKTRRVVAFALLITFAAAIGYGLLASFSTFYITLNCPDVNAGLFFTFVGCSGLAANPLVGWLSDRMKPTPLITRLLLLLGLGIALLALAPTIPAIIWAASLCAGCGYFGVITCVLSLIAKSVASSCRSSVLSLQQNGIDIGIATASGLFGGIFSIAGTQVMPTAFAIWGMATIACAFFALSYEKHPKNKP